MASDDRPLHVNSLLNLRLGEEGEDPAPAAQGPAPADAADRPAPPVPPPAGEGLDAGEVEALLGSGAEADPESD